MSIEHVSTSCSRVVFRYDRGQETWLSGAGGALATIASHVVGQVLLEMIEVSTGSGRIIIRPRTTAELARDACNAYAGPTDARAATRAGTTQLSCTDGSPRVFRRRYEEWLDLPGSTEEGTGTGSDSEVAFEAGIWAPGGSCATAGAGDDPDEILFHEMAHALRQVRGLMECAPMFGDYDTEEEFFAVVLSNMYTACKSPTPDGAVLRRSHHSFSAIEGTPDAWLDSHRRNRHYLGVLRTQMPDLWAAAALIPPAQCWFNPIRQMESPAPAPAPATTPRPAATTPTVTAGSVIMEDEADTSGEPQG